MGGNPARTNVRGDTRFAISSRFDMPPSHATAKFLMLAPARSSLTSVMPYQLMTAATFSSSVPGHRLSRLSLAGLIPVVSARCPPAEFPMTTSRLVSTLYSLPFRWTHRRAHPEPPQETKRSSRTFLPSLSMGWNVVNVEYRQEFLQPFFWL